jgi:hypothetical protein
MMFFVLALVVLVLGCRWAIGVLPPFPREILRKTVAGLGKLVYVALFGTGYKGGR